MYQSKNLPNSLLPVVKKWAENNIEFYLCPENLFKFKGKKIQYLTNPDIPLEPGSWYAASQNFQAAQAPELPRKQIEDIAMQLATYFRPTRWTIALENRCNYRCSMCPFHGEGYEDDINNDFWLLRRSQQRVVPKEEALRTIDILVQNQITELKFNPLGEIFLYPDWAEVMAYASQKGLKLGMMTNGSLINDEICMMMKKSGIRNVRVSLDALSYEAYSKVRSASRRHYEAATKAPLLLKKYGFEVNVHYVIQKENAHETGDFLEFWKATDVDSISIAKQLIFHDGNSSTINDLGKDEFIHGICSKYGNFLSLTNGVISACCEITGLYKDDDSHGLPKVSLLTDSFESCAESLKNLMATKDSPLVPLCQKCPLFTLIVEEEIVNGWIVRRTNERETWIRQK